MKEFLKTSDENGIMTMVSLIDNKDRVGTGTLSKAVNHCLAYGRKLEALYVGDGIDGSYSNNYDESVKVVSLYEKETNNIFIIAVSEHTERDIICVAQGNLSETTDNNCNVAEFVYYKRDKNHGGNSEYIDMDYNDDGGITVSNILGKEVNTNNKEGINPEECRSIYLYLGSSGNIENTIKAGALIENVYKNIVRLSIARLSTK
jgi:hypothetical protein